MRVDLKVKMNGDGTIDFDRDALMRARPEDLMYDLREGRNQNEKDGKMSEFVKLSIGLTKEQEKAVRSRWVPEERKHLRSLMKYIRIQKLARIQLGRDQISTAEHDKFLQDKRTEFRFRMRASTLLRKGLVLKSDIDAYVKGKEAEKEPNTFEARALNTPTANPLRHVIRNILPWNLQHVYQNAVELYLRDQTVSAEEKAKLKLSYTGSSIVDAVRNFIGI